MLAGNPVVAKIAFDDTIHAEDLRMEAKNYARLQKLQGSIIPKLYNIVEGSVSFNFGRVNAVFVCIVLQDCGDRINTFDEDQDFRLRTSEKYVYVFEIQFLLIFFLDLKY